MFREENNWKARERGEKRKRRRREVRSRKKLGKETRKFECCSETPLIDEYLSDGALSNLTGANGLYSATVLFTKPMCEGQG